MNCFDVSKLECVKQNAKGLTARCPICALEGKDKKGNHLSILKSGQFNCIVGSDNDPRHNKNIRAFLIDPNAEIDYCHGFYEPPAVTEKIYPEDSIKVLIPNYDYWEKRGIKPEILKEFEGGLAPDNQKSKLSGRFVFPVRNLNKKIIGFTGRLVKDNLLLPKWKHLFKCSRAVYPWNINENNIKQSKTCILVESIGDLLALRNYGINPVLCIFGLNINSHIVSTLISADVQKIIISLNNDDDPRKGHAAAQKIQGKLNLFFKNVRIRTPKHLKDWGECCKNPQGEQEIEEFKNEL